MKEENEALQNLVDDKLLFDEVLSEITLPEYKPLYENESSYEEELETEYLSGVKYEKELKKAKNDNSLL